MNCERPELERRQSSGKGYHGLTAVQRRFASLALRQNHEPSVQNKEPPEKTRIGLTLLHSPESPLIDFVFVHGLKGGSVKTWRKKDAPGYFWPKEWIPIDPDLSAVRTSTFGYQSDWLSRKDDILNVHDFGRKLLGELRTAAFLRRSTDTPIVLIGHSMGGLVIKKAYLLARYEAPELARRINAMVFLGTPHRGSDSAQLLHGILDLFGQDKQYVNDLMKNSSSLQLINDEFRHVADDIQVWSFFEERRTRMGTTLNFVVARDSATLGSKGERLFSLDANHREICKFESPEDENYATLRNALVTIVDEVVGYAVDQGQNKNPDQMHGIATLLGIFEAPKADLEEQVDLKSPGTCTWIERNENFLGWMSEGGNQMSLSTKDISRSSSPYPLTVKHNSKSKVYWLSAKPGSGKSVCAAHVITTLQEKGHDCCYFFFQHGVKRNSSLSAMMRSLAFQMSEKHADVRDRFESMLTSGISLCNDDEGSIWRQAFSNCILEAQLARPQFWVLDALDECSAATKLLPILTRLKSKFPLRILITSRPDPELERGFGKLTAAMPVFTECITAHDTEEDMRVYLKSDETSLGFHDEERIALDDRILAKSNGCFLWVKLVRYELEGTFLEESVDSILNEIPSEMSELYARTLDRMSRNTREKRLTQILLTWAVCCTRPMRLSELGTALKLDANLQVRDLRRSIVGLCGNLLYVDRNDTVQLAHSTVRDFLLDRNLKSEFAIRREEGHERLAKVCLTYMETEMRPPRSRSFGRGLETVQYGRVAFCGYAATSFSEHIAASSSSSDSLLVAISKFLSHSVLAWIEHVASEEPSLYLLTRTAKNLKQYLERRAKHAPPLGFAFRLVQDWSTDLIRLVAKFGSNLKQQPSAIFFLIPSIAPKESQLHQQSLNGPSWLNVNGSAITSWDDCVSCVEYRQTYATALACGDHSFAIGMKSGRVTVYDQSTCQERTTMVHRHHGGSNKQQSNVVRILAFSSSDSMLASSGLQSICLWSSEGELLKIFQITEPQVTMVFPPSQEEIISVTRSSRVARLPVKDLELDLLVPYERTRRRSSAYVDQEALQLPKQAPLAATISPEQKTLALLYRGKPVYLYNLEDDTLLGTCGRDVDSSKPDISVLTALFNPNTEFNMLAVAYQDGTLSTYDPWTQKELASVDGDAYSLAASPDGQFLATGNTGGTIRIWEFESLALLYIIRSGLEEVRSLAFTGDGIRIVDRRDTRVKIWEPSALVRRETSEDCSSLSDATNLIPLETGVNDEIVTTTSMCADDAGLAVFAGRSDGSVVAFQAETGLLTSTIQAVTHGDYIVAIASRKNILAVADAKQSVLIWEISHEAGSLKHKLLLSTSMAKPIQQLQLGRSGTRILVMTASEYTVWDLLSMELLSTTSHEDASTVLLKEEFASLRRDGIIYTRDWTSLQATQTVAMINSVDSRTIESCALTGSGRHLVASIIGSESGRSRRHVIAWISPFTNSDGKPTDEVLSPVLELPTKHVLTFIGMHADKVIFLDHDLWICSLDLNDAHAHGRNDIRRHIFIPPDFVGGPTVARPIITTRGDIVFSKEGQLAIIKGALDWNFT